MNQLTHGSLFAGIGGFDLGFERAGIKTVWQVEIDPFCRKVLEKHWPNVKRFKDIRTCAKLTADLDPVDVISGGFPCQDVSHAGRRVGIDGKRSGLWWEMRRIICTLRPRFVVVENVTGLFDRGMQQVLGEMAKHGFDAEWCVLPACAFGAPHPRERVFILAYAEGFRPRQLRGRECSEESKAPGYIHWPQVESSIEREIDGVPGRVDRLTALGNAVVPQITEWIGRRIVECAEQSEAGEREVRER